MLFIFRKLRRSFFLPGKVRTYLAYAIGEILLIVVGILIAVQIGDWKDARKLDRQWLELIENLKVDFQTNLERIDETLSVVETSLRNLKQFLSVAAVDNSHLSIEQLRSLGETSGTPIMFRPALGTYQSASTDGSISLLKDGKLTELFIEFEKNFSYYLINQDLHREANLTGESMNIRRRLGSLAVLIGDDTISEAPETYLMTDQQYREFIAEKDVYAYFEIVYTLQANQRNRLQDANESAL